MMPESQERREGLVEKKLHGGEWQVRFGEGL